MRLLYNRRFEEILADRWNTIDPAYKKAFFFILGINFLAFGFEMTNLTLHHDDVSYIFIQSDILGHYLGRFGLGWLYYYTQNAYYMPFLQMLQGLVLMTVYGILVSRFWGLRGAVEVVLVSAVLCVFPYMAQIYAYNVIMVALPTAHLLSAAAVILSSRATVVNMIVASLLYVGAFSIYQSVVANAATIFLVWVISRIMFTEDAIGQCLRKMVKPALAVLVSVAAGGMLYVIIVVFFMELDFDSYQAAGQAFSMKDGLNLSYAASEIINGTRAFFAWPENYFPLYLKRLQLIFIVIAGIFCILMPKGLSKKLSCLLILVLIMLSPRVMQLIHPQGNFHAVTLTAYAVVVAGCVMIVIRAGNVLVRNLSGLLAIGLLAGYILQCNWISTVNYLNTLAHYTTFTQILARIKSLPREQWDGVNVAVLGNYEMYSGYPYKKATGVATTYMDYKHAQRLAYLMRENLTFIGVDQMTSKIQAYAADRLPWPHPESVSVLDNCAVLVLSSDAAEQGVLGQGLDSTLAEPTVRKDMEQ